MAFDENKYKKLFESRFGAGSFDRGLSQARDIGRLKAQASFAKQDYTARLKAAQAAAKKKTYDDAVDYFKQNKESIYTNPVDNSSVSLSKDGGYRFANFIQNNPNEMKKLTDQGFNKDDIVNAIYNASSDGKFQSKGAYSDYSQQLTSENKAKSAAFKAKNGMTEDEMYQLNKPAPAPKKKKSADPLGVLKNFLTSKDTNKDGKRDGLLGLADRFILPISQAADEVLAPGNNAMQIKNEKEKYGKIVNPLTKAGLVDRGTETKVLHGAGTLLGYASPYGKAYKGVDLAFNKLPKLAKLATNPYAQRALKGGLAGITAEAGLSAENELVNPDAGNIKDYAARTAIGGIGGAVGDPLLHGLGKGLSRLFKNPTPPPSPELLGLPAPKTLGLPTPQLRLNEPQLQLPKPFTNRVPDIPNKSVQIKGTPLLSAPREMIQANKLKIEYQNEFQDAVKQQYNYLKSSMGKGVDYGTTGQGLGNLREVNGSFSVSRNPKWYQDFYKDHGRKPNNSELMQLAEEHVKNGFADEVGNLPAYSPKSVQEIDNQINEIQSMIKNMPDQETQLQPILSALNEDRSKIVSDFNQAVGIHSSVGKVEQITPSAPISNEPPLAFKQQKEFNMKDNYPLKFTGKMNPKDTSALKSVPKGLEAISKPKESVMPNHARSSKLEFPTFIRSVKTKKTVNSMSKEELTAVYKQLEDKHAALSKGKGNEQKLAIVQDDMERVKKFLDLQFFGENAPKPKGKPYESIASGGSGGKLLRADSLPENKFDAPYRPGDPLPDTRSHIGTKTEKTPIGIKETANRGVIKTIDNLHRLDQFDSKVKKVLGHDLKPSESTHVLGLNSRGSDMISKQILTENMVNKKGEPVGKSLKEITMKVPKGKLKDFEDYLVNQHAITRMERGEKVFPDEMKMTTGKSKEIVKNYETTHPEFKQIAKQYYDYNKNLGKHWLVDTGILSKEQWEGYLQANPHYVPNNRIFSDIERPLFYGMKKGFANQSNPVKKAIGSQRKIVSPIESTIEHTAQYVKTAKRNEVMQSLINNIKQDPKAFKDWAEIVPTDKTPSSIMETLQKEGVDGVLENLNKGFDQKPDLAKGNIVTGIIDGQKVHVKVNDPYLLDAITNLTPVAQNLVIHTLGRATRVMKNLTTGINPVFSLTRNIFRDIPTSFVNSKTTNNPLIFSKDLVGSVVSVIKNDELYRSFKAVGGGHSSPISSDVNLLAQSKRSILPKGKGLLNGAKHYGGKAIGALENLNNTVESAPRLAEFKRIAKNGDYDSKMKALYEANDVTVNFNKFGNWAKEVDAVVPYFNAAVQGLDKTARVFFSPQATAAEKATAGIKAFTAITIPSILMYAVNHNNPNYQKVSNYIKDTNILIPKSDGTFYKIPKPRELGVVFGSDVERVLRSWADQDPKAFQDFGTNLWNNFKPPVRTIAAPINDLRANKNFMDAPIIPGDLQNLSPQYQYDSKTSEVSKKLGGLLGFSPMKADYLAKSYGGIIGELGLPATTKNTTIGNTLKQKVTVDPVFSNDLQRRFYDQKTKLDQAHNNLTKQGVRTSELNEPLRKTFSQTSTQMGKIRKQMKQVQNDGNLSADQRLIQLRKLQDFINRLAEQANKNVR